jgi:hypothetical protein
LVSSSLKFGDFHCPIDYHKPSIDYLKPSLIQDHSCISVSKVFGSLKNKLPETSKGNPISNSNSAHFSSLGFSKVVAPSSSRTALLHQTALPNRAGQSGKEPMHASAMQAQDPRVDSSKDTRAHEENLEKDLQFTSSVASRSLGCF